MNGNKPITTVIVRDAVHSEEPLVHGWPLDVQILCFLAHVHAADVSANELLCLDEGRVILQGVFVGAD